MPLVEHLRDPDLEDLDPSRQGSGGFIKESRFPPREGRGPIGPDGVPESTSTARAGPSDQQDACGAFGFAGHAMCDLRNAPGGVLHQQDPRVSTRYLVASGTSRQSIAFRMEETHRSDEGYTAPPPMIFLAVLTWILWSLAVCAVVLWLVMFLRLVRILLTRPTVRQGVGLPAPIGGWPSISVIVPAHNEERVIERCARSLLEQDYPHLQCIFVLDRCTDATAERLAAMDPDGDRLQIIENTSCPSDWAGKCNAARVGAQEARGDLLLFMDADTFAAPQLLRAAVAVMRERGVALLSLLSTLTCEKDFEVRSQSVASMMLLTLYPPDMVNRMESPRPFANGQFMLFDRDWYDRIGGHEAVKDDLLEDIAFARCIHSNGARGNVLMADGLFTCSMYSSREAFHRGWQRIFIEACRRKPARLRKHSIRLVCLGAVLPVALLAGVIVGLVSDLAGGSGPGAGLVWVAAAGLCLQVLGIALMCRMGRQPIRSLLRFPLGCLEVARILRRGAQVLQTGEPVVWGGREYVLESR